MYPREDQPDYDGELVLSLRGKLCNFYNIDMGYGDGCGGDCYEVEQDKYEIMDFVGLKDKNGVEIYEGDVVQVHKFCEVLRENMSVCEGEKEFVAQIDFSPFGGVFLKAGKYDSGPLREYEGGFHEESLEVIGNIYENGDY